jgi:hypothetical protein
LSDFEKKVAHCRFYFDSESPDWYHDSVRNQLWIQLRIRISESLDCKQIIVVRLKTKTSCHRDTKTPSLPVCIGRQVAQNEYIKLVIPASRRAGLVFWRHDGYRDGDRKIKVRYLFAIVD